MVREVPRIESYILDWIIDPVVRYSVTRLRNVEVWPKFPENNLAMLYVESSINNKERVIYLEKKAKVIIRYHQKLGPVLGEDLRISYRGDVEIGQW